MPPTSNPNIPATPEPQPAAQPENPNLRKPEQTPAPAAPETAPATGAGAPPPVLPAIPPVSAAAASAAPAAAPAVPAIGPTPAVANDVDVIEKEWVDQADKIIAKTKGDPYIEEESEEALQQDYLKKRYNHDVKKPDAG